MSTQVKILHTSDWHLGRSLYGRKRHDEFSAFLDWLDRTIESERIDVLLVAGDIFDTGTPGNRAQELYYGFLCRVSSSCCRHIVVIAGNHDSPSFLDAPKALLRMLNMHVVGAVTDNPADEVIALCDERDNPYVIVCAVPYLRDKDIRTAEPGETNDEKNAKLVDGLKKHYASVCAVAGQKQSTFAKNGHPDVPIVAMGHLFAAGGKTVDGDGVRELYVGSLARVGVDAFPSFVDYVALGHLHVPQCVGDAAHIRYCGSPIPMGYGEATQDKTIVIVQFNHKAPTLQHIIIPCFQPLEKITGTLDDICVRLKQLKQGHSTAWLEINYVGADAVGNLREILDNAVKDSTMEIRRIKNAQMMNRTIGAVRENETLNDLDVGDVFVRRLDASNIPAEDRAELMDSYNEILKNLREEDKRASE